MSPCAANDVVTDVVEVTPTRNVRKRNSTSLEKVLLRFTTIGMRGAVGGALKETEVVG